MIQKQNKEVIAYPGRCNNFVHHILVGLCHTWNIRKPRFHLPDRGILPPGVQPVLGIFWVVHVPTRAVAETQRCKDITRCTEANRYSALLKHPRGSESYFSLAKYRSGRNWSIYCQELADFVID